MTASPNCPIDNPLPFRRLEPVDGRMQQDSLMRECDHGSYAASLECRRLPVPKPPRQAVHRSVGLHRCRAWCLGNWFRESRLQRLARCCRCLRRGGKRIAPRRHRSAGLVFNHHEILALQRASHGADILESQFDLLRFAMTHRALAEPSKPSPRATPAHHRTCGGAGRAQPRGAAQGRFRHRRASGRTAMDRTH